MKSEYGVGSTFTFYIRTCRISTPQSPELKMQISDFNRVKEELQNACGSSTGLCEIDDPLSTVLLRLTLPEPGQLDVNNYGSSPDIRPLSLSYASLPELASLRDSIHANY